MIRQTTFVLFILLLGSRSGAVEMQTLSQNDVRVGLNEQGNLVRIERSGKPLFVSAGEDGAGSLAGRESVPARRARGGPPARR